MMFSQFQYLLKLLSQEKPNEQTNIPINAITLTAARLYRVGMYNKKKKTRMSRNYKFKNPEGVYFVSFAVVNWLDVFTRNEYKNDSAAGYKITTR